VLDDELVVPCVKVVLCYVGEHAAGLRHFEATVTNEASFPDKVRQPVVENRPSVRVHAPVAFVAVQPLSSDLSVSSLLRFSCCD